MKQITGLVILMGASALAAAQSPPSSTGTDTSHATAPAATSSTSTTPAAAPSATSSTSTTTTTTSSNVAVTPQSSSSSTTEKKDEFKVPRGYRRVVRGGEERFCRSDPVPNSRVQKQEVCLTQTELEAEQRGTQDFIQGVQRNSGTAMYSQPNGAGGR